MAEIDERRVAAGIQQAIETYVKSRHKKVHAFVKKYFSIIGAMKLHRKALGLDIVRGPINITWSVVLTGFHVIGGIFKLGGLGRMSRSVKKLPRGFETTVQKEVRWLLYTELLEIPYQQGNRSFTRDALLDAILNEPDVESLFVHHFSTIRQKSSDPKFRSTLENNLREYATSRTAAADLAGNIITIAVGAAVFKQLTPGAMATGSAVATAIAQKAAISNFFLGSALGSLWYSIFPASASMGLIAAATGSIMAVMAIVTSFVGVITDPLQAAFGIHQKRLHKFIDALGNELRGSGKTKFEIRDYYYARVFDLLDIVKMASATVVK